MKITFCLLSGVLLAGCAMAPVSPAQRAAAADDIAENRPHPPALAVRIPGDTSFDPLRCYNNGEDTVCHREPNKTAGALPGT